MEKFPTGRMVMTGGVSDKMDGKPEFHKFVVNSLGRHTGGDWGDLSQDDRAANDQALIHGGRLFSAYEHPELPKIWIITEADRSATTVLFPDEY